MGPGAAPTLTVSSSVTAISSGGSAVLTVTAANATQVTVTGTDGSSYTLAPTGGTQTVTPTVTTTYTAVAVGVGGAKVSATATVTIGTVSTTTVTLSANPASVASGGSSVLTAMATNATQVTVTGTDGSSYTLQPTGGTQTVTPAATTTYTAVATGSSGKVTATATVTVTNGTPSNITISATPASIVAGGSSVLSVTAANAAQVKITGTDGSSYTLSPAGGTQTVTPAATTTYTAIATTAGGVTTSATATVTVGGPTVTIVASPTSIAPGASSTLTVTAANASQVQIFGTDSPTVPYPYTLSATGGSQLVTPTATTTYTAVATNANGTKASATVTVTVGTEASVTITAAPTSISAGGSSTLTVMASNASQVTVTGTDKTSYTLPSTGGPLTVTPSATTTYTATAAANAGANATATTTVTVSPAPTVTFSASPAAITPGSSSVLTVSATNAIGVTITGTDGSSYTLQPTGGTQTVSPAKSTTYTAIATAAAGGKASSTATVTVGAGAGVAISANPTSISSGSSSVLTVTATNATQVTVSGSDGTSYTLSPNGGTQSVSPTATTTYTAIATSANGINTSANTTITVIAAPTVTIAADPTSIASGGSSVLTVKAANATAVTLTGSDNSSYTLQPTGGTQSVTPTANVTYTATATGTGGNATAMATVTVTSPGSLQSISHVVFMLQENHSFDNYFGMLNPYRASMSTNGQAWDIGDDGVTYTVDGIDNKLTTISNSSDTVNGVPGTAYSPFKLTSTCVDDMSSAWLESYGDVNRYNFATTRPIVMDGFVHTAEGFAASCQGGGCSGSFTDTAGQRAMGYYDDTFLNYYYFMASEFALSDRWFSPVASKSIDNRIATLTGGTTQGLTHDPGSDDKLSQLPIPTIFGELSKNNVSWKIYYTVTQGSCLAADDCTGGASAQYPAINFTALQDSYQYLYENPGGAACTGTTQASSVVGDTSNSFCIDPNHIAPLTTYFTDLTNNTLPSFSFIEAGYSHNDEHPGSGGSILAGQTQVANVVNAFMASPEWSSSVFFLSYDEGGGPYDHVPPVPGHSNDYTDAAAKANYPDIGSIAVNPDGYNPCPLANDVPFHCDVRPGEPGIAATDAPTVNGFAAQLGFRLPNIVISPFTRKHYVSHIPMDHTAIIKFVENRFIGPSANLTARDAAQPNLLDFFDFTGIPWATPPTPPTPVSATSLGYDPCHAASMGP